MNGSAGDALGLYISIPFCRSKCTYCNFASGVFPASDHARYIDRVIDDMRSAQVWAQSLAAELPRRVDTVYLGGGTPSLLAPDLVLKLFAAIRNEFDLEPEAEITAECAPGQLSDTTLEAMLSAGVNRVSLGVQSFIDSEAQGSGRLHSRLIIASDLERLRAAGITNLNLDLIAGLAGQTFDTWQESLNQLVDSGVPHASVYMLEVDEDSRLGRELLTGGARYHAGLVPTDDAIARMYEMAVHQLSATGLAQYEISNFAQRGFESRHNLRYWQRKPYLGLGLDASSMLRSQAEQPGEPRFVLRSKTTDDLKAYLAGPELPETAWLSPERQHEEAWFLGLRMNAGVSVAAVGAEFGAARISRALDTLGHLTDAGLVKVDEGVVRLTNDGRLLSNEVFQEFLTLEGEEERTAHPATH